MGSDTENLNHASSGAQPKLEVVRDSNGKPTSVVIDGVDYPVVEGRVEVLLEQVIDLPLALIPNNVQFTLRMGSFNTFRDGGILSATADSCEVVCGIQALTAFHKGGGFVRASQIVSLSSLTDQKSPRSWRFSSMTIV